MAKKIKALLVSPFFFPTNTYQQELCQKIVEDNPDIDISVLCYQTTDTKVNKYGLLKMYYVPCFPIIKDQFVLPDYFKLKGTLDKLRKEKRFDVVFTETRFFDSAWWLPFLARSWKVPAIIIEHCASSIKHQFFAINLLGRFFDWLVTKLFLNQYKTVLCSNRKAVEYLKSFGLKNVALLGTGVDADFFSSNLQEKKVSSDKIVITFASRLIYTKGINIFYRSIKPLVNRYPNIEVRIGGTGPCFNDIKKHIDDDKLQDRISLLGALTREKMSKLLAETNIFVYPSFHHDGIPNVILEAAASNCAIVSSRIGGIGEVVINDETGIMVDNLSEGKVGQAIEELIEDKEKRIKLGKNARKLVTEQYRWSNVADRMSSLLVKAVDRL